MSGASGSPPAGGHQHDSSTGTIAGTVRDPSGAPVEGAVVILTAPSPPHRDLAAVTAATGAFGLGQLTPGSYTVAVNAAGYRTRNASVEVAGGREAAVVITMERDDGG